MSRELTIGADHNLLSNRTGGDPHPMYVRKDSPGAGSGLAGGTIPGEMLYWNGAAWVPAPLLNYDATAGVVSTNPFQVKKTSSTALLVTDGGSLVHLQVNTDSGETTLSPPTLLIADAQTEFRAAVFYSLHNPVSYPYTINAATDYSVEVDSSAAPHTVKMPAVPNVGFLYIVGDTTGNAGTNNITIDGNGHNINGVATKVISSPFGSLSLFYNGIQWVAR